MIKLYKLPDNPKIEGLRPMKNKDISQVHKLLNDYLKLKKKKIDRNILFFFFRTFKIYTKYNEEEIKHWFLPRKDVVYTYVVEKNKVVTDFFSFYSLPSSILKHPVHKMLKVK